MKNKLFFAAFVLVFLIQIIALSVFAAKSDGLSQDAVSVNEAVQSVTRDFYNLSGHKNQTELDYAVIDFDENVLFKTRDGISESINEAVSHRDTVLDIVIENSAVGKIIIYNGGEDTLHAEKVALTVAVSVCFLIECGICLGYALYMHARIVKPFRKLKGFAERVAGGNLDIPLEMDRDNVFGAFTESFDIMRAELKKARLAEAEAQRSKKELVAKLSHDIKTPVASIKAVSEVGYAVAKSEKDRENYSQIIRKSDQINSLVTNLFTATLEELQKLDVNPAFIASAEIGAMIENADYLRRANKIILPDCLLFADRLRLQQVFDNVFANSYKYAGTDVDVSAELVGNFLCVGIEDFGGGVDKSELPALKEKFKRGKNSAGVEGAGLGLYISDYFMNAMRGALDVENGAHGLKVTIKILMGD